MIFLCENFVEGHSFCRFFGDSPETLQKLCLSKIFPQHGITVFYAVETNDSATRNNGNGNEINKNKTITSKPFEYKTKIIGRTPDDNNTLDTENVVPLKYQNNFLRVLGFHWLPMKYN